MASEHSRYRKYLFLTNSVTPAGRASPQHALDCRRLYNAPLIDHYGLALNSFTTAIISLIPTFRTQLCQVAFWVVCICAFTTVANAQLADSLSAALAYYPLQEGNKWQYRFNSPSGSSEQSGAYPYREVVGDTLLPNGKLYKKILEGFRAPYVLAFERIDSTEAIVYRFSGISEKPLFLLPTGSIERTWDFDLDTLRVLRCSWTSDRMVFGQTRPSWRCTKRTDRNSWSWELVVGFGQVYYFYDLEGGLGNYELRYSSIGLNESGIAVTTEDHPHVSERISVYPNPVQASEMLSIEGLGGPEGQILLIVDVLGRERARFPIASNSSALRAKVPSSLVPGLYFILIKGKKSYLLQTIVVL